MSENEVDPLDADDIGTFEKGERYLKGVVEENTKAPAQFAQELMAGKRRVFFYAGSELDFQPLHRFTHVADTFILVDPRKTYAEFEQERLRLINQQTNAGAGLAAVTKGLDPQPGYRVVTEVTGELAEMWPEAGVLIPNLQDRPAWGAVQRLERHVGGTSREIWLLFIAGSPLAVYRKLFIETGAAPECLALPKPEFPDPAAVGAEAMENLWGPVAGWNGVLGHLLRDNDAPLPKLLLANDVMEWPVHSIHYVIPKWRSGWTTNVHKMTNDPWPDLAPASRAGARRVVLTRKPINPHHATAVGAVVVTSEKYHHYRWPANALVILSAPPVYPEHAVPDGPGVVNVNIEGAPLLQALARLEAICAERGVTTVAVQRLPGFEDEAADLALWRQKEGQIKELIVHLNCDGHLIDFAQAADLID